MSIEKYAIIDLHLHLDGSLSTRAILDAARTLKISLPANNERDLFPYLKVPENCQSLNEYLERFDIPNRVLKSKLGLRDCTLDLLERLANNGLKYVEIRMAPQLSETKFLSQKSVVKILIKTCKKARKFGIFSNLILCLMRGENTHENNFKTIEAAKLFLRKGVVAVDLAGAEALYPNEMFEDEFNLINKYRIPLIIHAGEAAGPESVKTALSFNPYRLGHGIHSTEDQNVMKMLKDRDVCLEICPKSELDTKTISTYNDLPIKKFMDAGIKITINTDDMTVSDTTLKKEFETLEKLGFNDNDFYKFASNAIDASFASNKIKKNLRKLIQ